MVCMKGQSSLCRGPRLGCSVCIETSRGLFWCAVQLGSGLWEAGWNHPHPTSVSACQNVPVRKRSKLSARCCSCHLVCVYCRWQYSSREGFPPAPAQLSAYGAKERLASRWQEVHKVGPRSYSCSFATNHVGEPAVWVDLIMVHPDSCHATILSDCRCCAVWPPEEHNDMPIQQGVCLYFFCIAPICSFVACHCCGVPMLWAA
jgi:hypothetical protein